LDQSYECSHIATHKLKYLFSTGPNDQWILGQLYKHGFIEMTSWLFRPIAEVKT